MLLLILALIAFTLIGIGLYLTRDDRDLGCCTNCAGTGRDAAAPETNGKCWDCYGTGHSHPWNH